MATLRQHLPSRHTVAVALATLAALAVALSAFTRSFSALSDLAVMHQWPVDEAWILPVALDGMIIVPTVAAVVRRDARWYAWSLLAAGTILSCAGNGIHAWLTASSQIAVALAIVPPLFTFFAVHLAIVIARQDRDKAATTAGETATEPADRATDPDPTVAPTDPDKTTSDTERDETARPVRRLRVAPATPASSVAAPAGETAPVATQQTLSLDVAPAATDEDRRALAVHRVVAEGWTVRATGASLGVSKDKVQRWVTAHRATHETATVAG